MILSTWESIFTNVLYNNGMTKSDRYEMNEKDIDSVIRFLKTIDPKNATPEMAIVLLEHLQATVHTMSHKDPETLLKIYNELKQKKAVK